MRKFYLKLMLLATVFFIAVDAYSQCTLPAVPVLSGTTNACKNSLNGYNVTNYSPNDPITLNWSLSGGGTLQSGPFFITKLVQWGTTAGNYTVSVSATNACGTSATANLVVTVNNVNVPPIPTQIYGPTEVCGNTVQEYSVDAVAGLTTSWTVFAPLTAVPTGVNKMEIAFPSTGGSITGIYATYNNGSCSGTPKALYPVVYGEQPWGIFNSEGNGGVINECLNTQTNFYLSPALKPGETFNNWSLSSGGTMTTSGATASVTWNSAGPFTLSATKTDACGVVSTKSISIIVLGGVTPNGNISSCMGSTVTLNGTVGDGVGYQWTNNGSNIPGATNASYNVTQIGFYRLNTEISQNKTCISSPVSVVFLPRPSATITSANSSICTGGSTSVSGMVTANESWTLTLSNGGGTVTGTGNGPWSKNVSPTVTTTYTIASLVGATCTSIPSDLTGSKTVTVNSLPTATISPSPSTTFCASGVLTANTGANLTYQWIKDGTDISGATASTYAATQSGSYQVRVTNTTTTCPKTSTATTVTINPLPTATISPSPSAAFCVSGVLTANTGANLTYQWIKDGTNISGATASTYTVTQSGSYQIRVTNTTTTCVNTSTPTTVTINTLPTATISPSPSVSYCVSGVLTANTGANLTYQWIKDGTNISGATASTYTATQSGSYQVRVTNTATTCVNTSTPTTVTINPLPTATISPSPSVAFCVSGLLTANTGANLTHQWIKDGTNISGATASTYTATQSGSYQVRVTNTTTTCANTSTATTVTINPLPTAAISPSPSASFCVSGVLTANTGANLTYQWIKDGTNIPSATASTYTATQSGNYQVRVTNSTTTCYNTSTPTSVTINILPSATITPSPSASFCGSGVLSANTGPNLSYQWIKNGIDISGTASTYPVTQSGSYQVRVTNSTTSCFNTSTASSITINPYPTAAITSSNSDLCIGNSGQVSGTITASGSWALTLSNGGGTVTGAGSGTWSIGVTPNSSITYSIASLNDTYCSAVPGGITGSTTFTVYTPYDPYITSLYDVCSYGYTVLVANGAYGATSYEWSNGGVDQSIYANPYTTYTVVAKFGDCSSNPVSFYVEPCVEGYCYDAWGNQIECLQPQGLSGDAMRTFPNPANNEVTVQLPENSKTELTVTLVSKYGHEVMSSTIPKGQASIILDTKNIGDGVYIVLIKSPKGAALTKKVIIKH